MSTNAIILLVILAVVVLCILYGIGLFNNLVTRRNEIKNAFAQVEVQLKRRYDLIPNLVATAKGYLSHERDTFEAVTAARNTALAGLKAAKAQPGDAQKIAQLSLADGALNSAMGRLNVTLEAYPELRAVEAMQQLSEEISSTENKVAYARQFFNDAVLSYNNLKQSFPAVLLAASFGHGADAKPLEFSDTASIQQAPQAFF